MDRTAATGSAAERRAVGLAFICNFVLMGSYYVLRPVRDTVATVVGVGHLQELFSATFVGTILASAVYGSLASRIRLSRLLPGAFWFWLLNLGVFTILFRVVPDSRWLGAAYYVWFSVVNLFMVSVFWSLMVDVFAPDQAIRWFALIAAGGALGAIAGPLATRALVRITGLGGLMMLAALGFGLVIVFVHMLMRQKDRLRHDPDSQSSSLDGTLRGGAFEGFSKMIRSRYFLNQAAFMLLMTWVNTIAYFCQTDIIARSYSTIADRARAIADIDLVVNVCTAAILLLGLSRFMRRFGVTASLVLNPLLMVFAFMAAAMSPTLLTIQVLQIVRRVAQYAIARPSREICFTVVEQGNRYKTKSVIDTVVYRFGDVSSAWMQTGIASLGFGPQGAVLIGMFASIGWGAVALSLGRRYGRARRGTADADGGMLESATAGPATYI